MKKLNVALKTCQCWENLAYYEDRQIDSQWIQDKINECVDYISQDLQINFEQDPQDFKKLFPKE